MKRLSWFVFFSIFTFSCLDQPDCYQLNNNEMVVAFKIVGGGADSFMPTDVITVTGAEGALTVSSPPVSSLVLQLNPYADTIGYTFTGSFAFGPEETKQLVLNYKSLIQFVSEDCGNRFVFTELAPDTIATDFDFVKVVNSVPTNPTSLNLEIYRCPRPEVLYVDLVDDPFVTTIKRLPNIETQPNGVVGWAFLPLDIENDSTTYVFSYQDKPSDTLKVTYRRTTKTLSRQCGPQVFISEIKNDTLVTDFSEVNILLDSIYDPPKVNFELTH